MGTAEEKSSLVPKGPPGVRLRPRRRIAASPRELIPSASALDEDAVKETLLVFVFLFWGGGAYSGHAEAFFRKQWMRKVYARLQLCSTP